MDQPLVNELAEAQFRQLGPIARVLEAAKSDAPRGSSGAVHLLLPVLSEWRS